MSPYRTSEKPESPPETSPEELVGYVQTKDGLVFWESVRRILVSEHRIDARPSPYIEYRVEMDLDAHSRKYLMAEFSGQKSHKEAKEAAHALVRQLARKRDQWQEHLASLSRPIPSKPSTRRTGRR